MLPTDIVSFAEYSAVVADDVVAHPKKLYPERVGTVDDTVIDFVLLASVTVCVDGAPDPPFALYERVCVIPAVISKCSPYMTVVVVESAVLVYVTDVVIYQLPEVVGVPVKVKAMPVLLPDVVTFPVAVIPFSDVTELLDVG